MKITSFALALDIIFWFDRAKARPAFTTSTPLSNEDVPISAIAPSSASGLNLTSMTKEELIKKFISVDGNVEFGNITASPHYENCTRYFTGGYSMGYAYENDNTTTLTDDHLLPDEGIILSSGNPLDFESNDSDSQTTPWDSILGLDLSDADLANVVDSGEGIFDACYIEFDFKCSNEGSIPIVSFNYMFGSDEYSEYVSEPYNDVFALILNGENIAKLPSSESTTDVVSIHNVNFELNRQYFHVNDPFNTSHERSNGFIYPQLEADGFTVMLTAIGTPSQDPNEMNKIKIVVGDVGDSEYDSWVLLESGTFTCNGGSERLSPGPSSSKSGKSSGYSKSSKAKAN